MKRVIEVNGIKYVLHQKLKMTKILYLLENALNGKEFDERSRYQMKILSHPIKGKSMYVQVRPSQFPQFSRFPVITAILHNDFYSVEHVGKYRGDDGKLYMNLYIKLMDEREVNSLIPEIRNSERTKAGNAEIILEFIG